MEAIVKELKQKPKAARRKPSVPAKNATVTPGTTSKSSIHQQDNFSSLMKTSKTKPVQDKPPSGLKSPEMSKKGSDELPQPNIRERHSQTFKAKSAKKPLEHAVKNQDRPSQGKEPPKVVQDALKKPKEEGDTPEETPLESKNRDKKRTSYVEPVTTVNKLGASPVKKQDKKPEKTITKTPQKNSSKVSQENESSTKVIQKDELPGRDRHRQVNFTHIINLETKRRD